MTEIEIALQKELGKLKTHYEAELSELKAWQPIETAPKDGTPIIIMNMPDDMSSVDYLEYGPDSCMVAHWAGSGSDENWYLHGFPMLDADFGKNYWSGDGMFTNNGYLGLGPTHWMPLPPPPALLPNKKEVE